MEIYQNDIFLFYILNKNYNKKYLFFYNIKNKIIIKIINIKKYL